MDEHEQRPNKFTPPQASENTKNLQSSEKLSDLVKRTRSIDILYFMVGLSQFFFGLTVSVISIMGLIQPFWLAVSLSVFGTIAIISGVYFCYSAISSINTETLLQDSMRRIVRDQN